MRNRLFADAVKLSSSDIAWLVGLALILLVLLLAGAYGIARMRNWRQTSIPSLEQEIALYQSMVQKGDLSPQEYQRIVATLAEKHSPPPSLPPTS